jgi:MoxR-like ATPase
MTRHQIDKSTIYSYQEHSPDTKDIELAEVDFVNETKPTMITVNNEPYLPDEKLINAVNLSIALGRPLLLQGDPGCGKTRLAYAISYALGLPLEECHIKSTSRAQDFLYIYDAVSRLYDSQLKTNEGKKSLDVGNYIRLGPLGRAILRAQYGRRSVVLIDEIDKADLDFPNDLLLELDRLEFRIPEMPGTHYSAGDNPGLRPIIVITHNEEKPLPAAFLRRCIFHYMDFPEDKKQIEKILSIHINADSLLTSKAVDVLLRLRKLDLQKKPGISEIIDWVGYLDFIKLPLDQLERLPYIGVLIKQRSDQTKVGKEFS